MIEIRFRVWVRFRFRVSVRVKAATPSTLSNIPLTFNN